MILPVAVFGKSPKTTVRGALNPSQSLTAMLDQRRLRDPLCLRLQGDEGARRLPPSLVRARNNRRFEHGLVAVEGVLDLDARNVLAAGDDDVLGAVGDLDVAVRVRHARSPLWNQPALEGSISGAGVVEIALHHRVPRAA